MHHESISLIAADDARSALNSDNDPDKQPEKSTILSKVASGWRFSLALNLLLSVIVLAINLGATIWATKLSQPDELNPYDEMDSPSTIGIQVIYRGDCDQASSLNTGLHLMINVLSSALLAASNYCMQCLSAPTREDIGRLHRRGKWLDIGVPSIHNVGEIPGKRSIPWLILVLSSVPLHLLYNSAVFQSFGLITYELYGVEDALAGADSIFNRPFQTMNKSGAFNKISDSEDTNLGNLWENARAGKLRNLSSEDCIKDYGTVFQTSRSDLLLVTDPGPNSSFHGFPYFQGMSRLEDAKPRTAGCVLDTYEWICYGFDYRKCEKPCRSLLSNITKHHNNWRPIEGKRVKYCLSKVETPTCYVHLSIVVMAFVLIANFLKVFVILYLTCTHPPELVLVIGDAIESFMTSPDEFSTQSCLVSALHIKRGAKTDWAGPRRWSPVRQRWAAALSRRRWTTTLILYLIALSLSVFFLAWGINAIIGPHDIQTLWSMGLGSASETALIEFPNFMADSSMNIIWNVLFANIPHLLFSVLYFQYNALFTGMLAAKEWSEFGRKRRGLRVSSNPRGNQRSRHFLQLPYRWGIPLLVSSIVVHWLLSQSIFIVSFVGGDSTPGALVSTCGYSPVGIISVILASFVLGMAAVATGLLRLPTAMPVVGSCSLAIAAACHHHDGIPVPDEPLETLAWGVTRGQVQEADENKPGHCGFSSGMVEKPEVGVVYS